ncbi:MAG: DUF1080 domain-containing protein, partial [Verrucomicrobiota bacterium]
MKHLSLTLALFFAAMATSLAADAKSAAPWRSIPLIKDGKVAPDWIHIGWGKFSVDGDSLRTDCDERGMGLLVYAHERLGNCRIRVIFKTEHAKSNSGVYIRLDDGILSWTNKSSTAVRREPNGKLTPEMLKKLMTAAEAEEGVWYAVHHGFEVQITEDADPAHRTGAIYGLTKAASLPKAGPGAWRTMLITLEGSRVLVDIDGQRISAFDSETITPPAKRRWTEPKLDHKRPNAGYLALQIHDPGDVVWFKE